MQLTKSCTSYTTWFKVSRIRSILQPSYINTSPGYHIYPIYPPRKNWHKKTWLSKPNQGTLDMWDCFPKLECFESVCPRPSAPGRSESRNGPRCLLQRPPPGGFQGLGGGALGGGYRCLDHLTNPFPYHPNHSPMFPQWELPACPSSGSWDLKSGTSALRIPISIRNHCKGAPVAKAAPK